MKIILSKKGLDSSNSQGPVVIDEDKQMIFLPIPSRQAYDVTRYGEVFGNKTSLLCYCKEMGVNYGWIDKEKVIIDENTFCHLDPQLTDYFGQESFKGSFGQDKAAQTHLKNNGVKVGDLFLFYGWYKDKKTQEAKHTLFGYLQVGDIIEVNSLTTEERKKFEEKYPWLLHQPHWYSTVTHNTIYVASDNCSFKKKLKGFGMFKYDKRLDLTGDEMTSKTCWKIPALKNCRVSFKDNNRNERFDKEGNFKVADRCQELVVEECPQAAKWAINLIKKYGRK